MGEVGSQSFLALDSGQCASLAGAHRSAFSMVANPIARCSRCDRTGNHRSFLRVSLSRIVRRFTLWLDGELSLNALAFGDHVSVTALRSPVIAISLCLFGDMA